MDRFLRRATPFVLLMLTGLAWFGSYLPGYSSFERAFGSDALLRFVTGLLCIYVALLVVERQRMEQAFKQVLGAFRQFHRDGSPAPTGAPDAEATAATARREAVEILIGALESPDAAVRGSSATHLHRLTGVDLGEDPQAWRSWLAEQLPVAPSADSP